MKRNLLLDLDGTLTDSGPGIKNSFRHAFAHYGLTIPEEAEFNQYVGPPLLYSFEHFCGFSPEKAEQAVKVYREYYVAKGMLENSVYLGVPELLSHLKEKGYRLFIATGKPTVYAKQILEHFGLLHYFEWVEGIPLNEGKTTKFQLISAVLNRFDLHPEDCAMIGDRKYDIEGALQAGLTAFGVTYGYGGAEELQAAGAHAIAHNTIQLQEIITQWGGKSS